MNITLNKILKLDRCEEWTDERTTNFMKSRRKSGTKTISEFIEDVGVEDITHKEINWCLFQVITIKQRRKLLLDCITTISNKYKSTVIIQVANDMDEYISNNRTSKTPLRENREKLKNESNRLRRKNKDVTPESRFIHQMNRLAGDSNLIEETERFIYYLVSEYSELFTYKSINEYLKNSFE